MRLIACSLALSPMLIIAADVLAGGGGQAILAQAPVSPEYAPSILQGSALAILGTTLWYMLTRTFPAHTAALKEQRESFLQALQDERREAQNERVQTIECIERIVGVK